MRIAAISDIHGNLGALDAVLADIDRRGVDLTVNLGDILSGPLQPRETADRLMELNLPTICGNHERQLLAADRDAMGLSDRYAAETVTLPQRRWLAALPATRWAADDVFLCHATPDSDVACFLENIEQGELTLASLAQIEERAGACDAGMILCGHTHLPRVVHRAGGHNIVNPGSVGIQAYEGHHPIAHVVEVGSPHARYAIVERAAGGWTAELIAVPYDWESAARMAETNARPDWALALRTGFVKPALRAPVLPVRS
jgi:putative phosphoesterase